MTAAELLCDACQLAPYPADAARSPETGLPEGWVRRTIGRRTFTLCDCCGSIRHFKGGVSAYLQETLGIGPEARVDFAASSEPGSGLHRHRKSRGGGPEEPPTGSSP